MTLVVAQVSPPPPPSPFPPSCNKISYCRLCIKKTHVLIECPYVKAPADLLRKREENVEEFNGTVKASQSYYPRGHGKFRGGTEYDRCLFHRKD